MSWLGESFSSFTTNQYFAFVIGIVAAVLYWFQLLLLTQPQVNIGSSQIMGLVFAVLIAIIGWLRFVFTTAGSLKP